MSLAEPQIVAFIPARYASQRFPGKPLIDLDGIPMVVRVAQRVLKAKRVDRVAIVTDDGRIKEAADIFGVETVMTPSSFPTGTDRVAWAASSEDAEALIINVQGDEPLIDPSDLDALIEGTLAAGTPMGTLACPIDDASDPNRVTVVADQDANALYFSRSPIPHGGPYLLHVGVYAYRNAALQEIAGKPRAALETCERLEQLRALSLGMKIHVEMAKGASSGHSIDSPEDVSVVLEQIRKEEVVK